MKDFSYSCLHRSVFCRYMLSNSPYRSLSNKQNAPVSHDLDIDFQIVEIFWSNICVSAELQIHVKSEHKKYEA